MADVEILRKGHIPFHLEVMHGQQKVLIYLSWSTGFSLSSRASEHRGKIRCCLNKDQIITNVNDILPRAQACIESDGGAFEYKLKCFWRTFFPQISDIKQYK